MTGKNPRFETYFSKPRQWQAELNALRDILLDCQLTEELKWRQPCYTYGGANIVILSSYKTACVLGFFKGSLMPDPKKLLVEPGPNSKAARTLRFTSLEQITKSEKTIRSYIKAAIKVEQSGAKVDFSANKTVKRPEELEAALAKDAKYKTAFNALTPGRQRSWILYIEQAKQSATRADRVAKIKPKVLQGFGFHDEYKRKASK
jgi:uncharacterized protein YdeI (YjbR/CyaY-like superfamily)